jgi:ATP-dependent helicase/nuclease subunit A
MSDDRAALDQTALDQTAPDQAARDRIAHDLDTTLFVEAGAGSGKTKSLVERVLSIVASGTAELRSIAAITFTEKAGAELRDRLRRELQERAGADTDPEVQRRCRDALDQLDSAAIGTLHSFAQRILTEHPIEAGLPPQIEVLDEVNSSVEFERRWSAFRDQLFDDPAMERALLLLDAAGVKLKALDVLAAAFSDNWDLVAEQVDDAAPEPPSVATRLAPVLDDLTAICAERAECRDPEDGLAVRLEEHELKCAQLRAIDDDLELLAAIGPAEYLNFRVTRTGRKGNWRTVDIDVVRNRFAEVGAAIARVRDDVTSACAHRLAVAIRRFTLDAADERRSAGQLEFHDLLVMARAVLRDPDSGAEVRARLHERYQRLLLDEFQDTDPIQIELAVRIAAAHPQSETAGSAPWASVAVTPGHLFVVGDPKQSIYRFRRADIGTFIAARDRFATGGGDVVALTTNFRTVAPVIEWVNRVFAALMTAPPDDELPLVPQATYVALQPRRSAPPVGPSVAVVGRAEHPRGSRADTMRAAEAEEVAATVVRAIAEGWSVSDGRDDGVEAWRPARLGDITILVPARTSMPFLQEALSAARISYRAESSSLVYATRAVRDLLMVLRAVDDPTNEMHTVAALRTPLLACGDDDLFRFKVGGRGHWDYTRDQPATVPDDDPVAAGLAYLRRLNERRHWEAPSELLDRIARDRRALELGFAEGRPRDVWRRLRFVIDQARAWSEATNGGLRMYLRWIQLQSSEGARVSESVLPETDDDAVRIMTIHAAKGLEFPITIVSGMSTAPRRMPALAEVVFPAGGGVGYRFGKHVSTDEYEEQKPIDEQMDYGERMRLLYVACTRAQDHLVVSLHRANRAKEPLAHLRTNAELLFDGMGRTESGTLLDDLPDGGGAAGTSLAPLLTAAPTALLPLAEWERERDAALARATRPTTIAATALTDDGAHDPAGELAAGLHKRPRDLDLPPWLKGRYGTAIGRAVHGTLQTIDLATAEGIDAAVAAQCEAEAIPDRAGQVRGLVVAALDSPSVREAAARPHWREVYACTPIGERLLEGYIDLLYRGSDGLVVLDYKTAATNDPAELERRLRGYRLQGASYALAVSAATGEPVVRVTFLFLTPEGPVERELRDLDAAIDDVRVLAAAGREITVDEPATAG